MDYVKGVYIFPLCDTFPDTGPGVGVTNLPLELRDLRSALLWVTDNGDSEAGRGLHPGGGGGHVDSLNSTSGLHWDKELVSYTYIINLKSNLLNLPPNFFSKPNGWNAYLMSSKEWGYNGFW